MEEERTQLGSRGPSDGREGVRGGENIHVYTLIPEISILQTISKEYGTWPLGGSSHTTLTMQKWDMCALNDAVTSTDFNETWGWILPVLLVHPCSVSLTTTAYA